MIGAGPAGLAAAGDIARTGLSCLCLDKLAPGGLLINLGRLRDYLGETTGPDLAAALLDAATEAGAELGFGEVRAIRPGAAWTVETDAETHQARAVILATGLAPGTLGLAEEAAYEGRGLSHCAACDGPLYRGEAVIVAGEDRWAVQEAIDLAALVGHITLLAPGARDLPPNVTARAGRIAALEGADGLEAVVLRGGERLAVRAAFVFTDRRPALGFAAGLIATDAQGRAMVEDDLRTAATGLYAIGDVRSGAPEQAAAAITDGARAARAVIGLLGQSGQKGG